MTLPRRHRRSRAGALAFVLAAHGVLLVSVQQLGAWSDRGPRPQDQPPLVLRPLWLQPAAPPPGQQQPPPRQAQPQNLAVPRAAPAAAAAGGANALAPAIAAALPAPAAPQAITLPLASAPATSAPAAAAAAADAAVQAPLNLALPSGASAPWRSRSPALDALQRPAARTSFESRLAAAWGGDGPWREERIDADRVRLRRGNTCVEMHRSKGELLDPYNNAVSRKPWVAKAPEPC